MIWLGAIGLERGLRVFVFFLGRASFQDIKSTSRLNRRRCYCGLSFGTERGNHGGKKRNEEQENVARCNWFMLLLLGRIYSHRLEANNSFLIIDWKHISNFFVTVFCGVIVVLGRAQYMN